VLDQGAGLTNRHRMRGWGLGGSCTSCCAAQLSN
jgi:hypothetical protein